jgi:hypothetical protein
VSFTEHPAPPGFRFPFTVPDRFWRLVADRMDTGSVGINFFASNHAAPFGGRHDSGLGVEYGIEGLLSYTAYKSIHRRTWCGGRPTLLWPTVEQTAPSTTPVSTLTGCVSFLRRGPGVRNAFS